MLIYSLLCHCRATLSLALPLPCGAMLRPCNHYLAVPLNAVAPHRRQFDTTPSQLEASPSLALPSPLNVMHCALCPCTTVLCLCHSLPDSAMPCLCRSFHTIAVAEQLFSLQCCSFATLRMSAQSLALRYHCHSFVALPLLFSTLLCHAVASRRLPSPHHALAPKARTRPCSLRSARTRTCP